MYEGKNLSLQMIVWKGRGLIGKSLKINLSRQFDEVWAQILKKTKKTKHVVVVDDIPVDMINRYKFVNW